MIKLTQNDEMWMTQEIFNLKLFGLLIKLKLSMYGENVWSLNLIW